MSTPSEDRAREGVVPKGPEQSGGLPDRVSRLVELVPHPVWMAEPTGLTSYLNQRGLEELGISPEAVRGRSWLDLLHPEDAERSLATWTTCVREERPFRNEYRLRCADGTYRWYLAQAVPEHDPGGRVQRWVGTLTNIEELKRTERSLGLLDQAIQAITVGITITDPALPDNPIIRVNGGFERLTGYSAQEILGKNCRFLQGRETDRQVVAQVGEAVRQARPCNVEILNYRKDGTPFWNELSISPVRDEQGQLTYFVGVQTDITQRRQLERQYFQSQKMEAIGQLAGGVAHDFNNLLTIITGYSELLLQSLSPEDPARGLLEEIRRAGERSASLTRQLLAFSRKQVLAPRVLDLNEVVRDTEKMLRRVIGEDIRLVTLLHPQLDYVRADPGQLEQVLLNLAVNARDAMPRGGVLTIQTSPIQLERAQPGEHGLIPPGAYVTLTLTDSGEGMSDEVKQHIFEPFFTTKESSKGTGLGLSVVHGIVKQSEGHIEVLSERGHGTSFRIYLPRVDAHAHLARSGPSPVEAPRGAETIFLVEDDNAVRALARHVLRECGYTVLDAGGASEARQMAAQYRHQIDLLILDVVMPEMGGRLLAECLLELRPGMKVLYLSGYTDDAVARHGIQYEQVSFLQKPFTPGALAHKVREVLSQQPPSPGAG